MRKSTIWLLGLVMALSFIGLLYLQVSYIEEMVKMRNEQFDESVKRSLYQVSRNLEYDETLKKKKKEIAEKDRQSFSANYGKAKKSILKSGKYSAYYVNGNPFYSSFEMRTMTLDPTESSKVIVSKPPKIGGSSTLSQSTSSLHEAIKNRYLYQKSLLDEVVLDILYKASDKPLKERVNFKQLDHYLKSELENNGINLNYHFMVRDRNGAEVYRCPDYVEKGMEHVYRQVLFQNDSPDKMGTVLLNFPERDGYIFSSIRFLIPSFIFTGVLLITFISVMFNIFRQKKLTEIKNDFINNMTHEFKTPISTISLAAQMLNDPAVGKSPAMFKHISGIINDETKRLRFQVEKVLQMSMFDRQKTMLKKKETDMNELIAGVINTFNLKVEQYGGKIESELKADNAVVNVDEMHITNVIFNLMDNAVKYKKPDCPIMLDVKTWNEQGKLYISVQDNGVGMKKEDLKKIFDKFYRVHTGNLHNVKGFGLGLAYVKKIIQDHKGTIKVESELNVGTKFIIILPLNN